MPIEKEVATHSSILAWQISQMEDIGGLQSMGVQRFGYYGAQTQPQTVGYYGAQYFL